MTPPDHEAMGRAIVAFQRGDHAEAIRETFAHLLPDQDPPDLFSSPFVFVQGSSRVTVSIEDGTLWVRVPLVAMQESSATAAALRFALTRISGAGQLYEPRLHGEELHLTYSESVAGLHPHKLREVLRQMPFEADAHDDWMSAEFDCAALGREPIEPLSDDEFAAASALWRRHWDEVDELISEAQRARSMFFLNEVTAYAVYHLRYALPVHGYWWSRVTNAAATFNDDQIDPAARENALVKCIREMREVDDAALRGSLGHAQYTISRLADGTPPVIASNLDGKYLDGILGLFNAGRYMQAAVALTCTYCYLLGSFSWPAELEVSLLEGLTSASDTPWRDAAAGLLRHAQETLPAVLAASEGDNKNDAPQTAPDAEADPS